MGPRTDDLKVLQLQLPHLLDVLNILLHRGNYSDQWSD